MTVQPPSSPKDLAGAAKDVSRAARADTDASSKTLAAIRGVVESVRFLRIAVTVLAALVVVEFGLLAGVGYLAVKGAGNTLQLCNSVVDGRNDMAALKEQRARKILPGPAYRERKELVEAEAARLRKNADAARCQERYRLP